jgi:hypothetical protein
LSHKGGKYANKSPIFITNYGSATTTTIQDTSTGQSWTITTNTVLAFLALSISALAQCTSQRIGNFTYHHCDNGVSGTSQQIGEFTYHHFNNGASGTSQQIGGFTFHHFNDGSSATSQRIGNFTYHHFDDGHPQLVSALGTSRTTILAMGSRARISKSAPSVIRTADSPAL